MLTNNSLGSHFKSGDPFVYQGKQYIIEEKIFKVVSINEKEKQVAVDFMDEAGNHFLSNFWKSEYGKNPNIYMEDGSYKLVEISENDTVLCVGFRYDYQGYTQFNCIGGYQLCETQMQFTPSIDVEKHFNIINKYVSIVKNDELRDTCVAILTSCEKLLKIKPAASKHHHNYIGGLVQHTAEVISIAFNMSTSLKLINTDYIIVAALFHDMLKVKEYTDDGKFTEYGERIGHIYGSAKLFEDIATIHQCNEIDIENIVHIILSHHGKKEWGSPIEPKTPEAVIVHEADMVSSYINPIMTQINTSLNKDYYDV